MRRVIYIEKTSKEVRVSYNLIMFSLGGIYRGKIEYEERLDVARKVANKETSLRGIAKEKNIDKNVVKFWVKLYLYHGEAGLKFKKRRYTQAEKDEVIDYYKNHEISLIECSAKYLLTNPSTLRKWLIKE